MLWWTVVPQGEDIRHSMGTKGALWERDLKKEMRSANAFEENVSKVKFTESAPQVVRLWEVRTPLCSIQWPPFFPESNSRYFQKFSTSIGGKKNRSHSEVWNENISCIIMLGDASSLHNFVLSRYGLSVSCPGGITPHNANIAPLANIVCCSATQVVVCLRGLEYFLFCVMPSVAHVAGKTNLPYNIYVNIYIYICIQITLQQKSCKFSVYILSHDVPRVFWYFCAMLSHTDTLRHCPYRQGGPAPSTDGPQKHVSCLPFLAAFSGTHFFICFFPRFFSPSKLTPGNENGWRGQSENENRHGWNLWLELHSIEVVTAEMEWQKWWATNRRPSRSGHGRNDRTRSPFARTAAADLMSTCFAVEREGWRKKKRWIATRFIPIRAVRNGCQVQGPKLSKTIRASPAITIWIKKICPIILSRDSSPRNLMDALLQWLWHANLLAEKHFTSYTAIHMKTNWIHAAGKGHKPRIPARDPQEIPAPMGWW